MMECTILDTSYSSNMALDPYKSRLSKHSIHKSFQISEEESANMFMFSDVHRAHCLDREECPWLPFQSPIRMPP